MLDFLTFQTFITPTLLLLIYYVGVILIFLASYLLSKWGISAYFSTLTAQITQTIRNRQRLMLIILFVLCFLGMELFWRMIIEFFIAYFDMHDVLMKMGK